MQTLDEQKQSDRNDLNNYYGSTALNLEISLLFCTFRFVIHLWREIFNSEKIVKRISGAKITFDCIWLHTVISSLIALFPTLEKCFVFQTISACCNKFQPWTSVSYQAPKHTCVHAYSMPTLIPRIFEHLCRLLECAAVLWCAATAVLSFFSLDSCFLLLLPLIICHCWRTCMLEVFWLWSPVRVTK